jgi:hypothetical protein
LEEQKTDGNILSVAVCSTVGVYRIKHLRGCNSATLKMEATPLSETLVKLTIVHGVKPQQLFSDRYRPGEPRNLITWLNFLTDTVLLIRNRKTAMFENLHRFQRKFNIYIYYDTYCDSQVCNPLHI